jgi:hypothetical protein
MPPKSWRQLKKNEAIPSSSFPLPIANTNSTDLSLTSSSSKSTIVSEDFQPQLSSCVSFYDTLVQFGGACLDVWPEDLELKSLLKVLEDHNGDESYAKFITTQFHESYKDLYLASNKKDESIFSSEKPLFKELQVQKKMSEASSEIKDTIFEYIRLLVQWAGMYSMYAKCPENMMSSIAAAARDFSLKIESGDMDFSKLNPMTLGQDLMGSMSKEDIENFTKSIMEDGGENIKNMMTGMVNNLTQGAGGIPGGEGMADMLKMMLNVSMPDTSTQ